jgi:biopolymer transport protein ExbD
MKITPQRAHLLGLESVAMTDIVLNMFIFFFISFSLLYTFNPQRMQKLEISLPQASQAVALDDLAHVTISLTNEGVLYIDKQVVTIKELKERVTARYNNNPRLSVVLRADKQVRFKDVVRVLDLLNELGISRLNIATVRE